MVLGFVSVASMWQPDENGRQLCSVLMPASPCPCLSWVGVGARCPHRNRKWTGRPASWGLRSMGTGGEGEGMRAYFHSARDDGGDELLPDLDGVPGELAWAGHG